MSVFDRRSYGRRLVGSASILLDEDLAKTLNLVPNEFQLGFGYGVRLFSGGTFGPPCEHQIHKLLKK